MGLWFNRKYRRLGLRATNLNGMCQPQRDGIDIESNRLRLFDAFPDGLACNTRRRFRSGVLFTNISINYLH